MYRGPSAPVTCVTLGGPGSKTVFAGSWDKTIWSWDLDSKAVGRKFAGHTDFVKAVACTKIQGKDVLISGGADKKIIVWDVTTGSRLHTLQDNTVNMLAIQGLTVDPIRSTADEVLLASASSDPHIRFWKITLQSWEQVAGDSAGTGDKGERTTREHETSVYKLFFDGNGEEVDLWTSSGDGTAKCLSRARGFTSEDSFHHGDHVRAVAVTDKWVVTAGRDEQVKVWDRTSGRLHCSLEGHYDEITDLTILSGAAERLVSVSIDGTIRTWSLETQGLDALVAEQKRATGPEIQGAEADAAEGEKALTAEEEAELAALMDED